MQLTEAEGFQASLLLPGTAGRPAVERAPWRNKRATYQQSLDVLAHAKTVKPDLLTKTSTMLGLGESRQEVIQTMRDLRAAGVDVLTLGQYLRPSPAHLAVEEYVTPEAFDELRVEGEKLGFRYVAAGPMVRSSYKAGEFFLEHMIRQVRLMHSPSAMRLARMVSYMALHGWCPTWCRVSGVLSCLRRRVCLCVCLCALRLDHVCVCRVW
jgi:hypothetical protein